MTTDVSEQSFMVLKGEVGVDSESLLLILQPVSILYFYCQLIFCCIDIPDFIYPLFN